MFPNDIIRLADEPLHTVATFDVNVDVGTGRTVTVIAPETAGEQGALVTRTLYVVVTDGLTVMLVPVNVLQVLPPSLLISYTELVVVLVYDALSTVD